MVETTVTIQNNTGLHARPASAIITISKGFHSKITMHKGRETADCKNIMSLLSCNVIKGTTVVLRAEGEDEQAALNMVADYIQNLKE